MKKIIIMTGAAAAALGIAACGPATAAPPAQHHAAATTAAAPSVNYRQQYLHDVAAYNAAVQHLNKSATSVTDPTVVALREAAVAQSREMLQQSWPANAQADVHALAVATAKEAADLSASLTLVTLASVSSDVSTAEADAQAVRADLGLPAIPGS